MKVVTAASPVVPDAAPRQNAPPQYDSVSHAHRVQHYDSPQWKETGHTVCFAFTPTLPGGAEADPASEWAARLRVKTRDLPRLMQEGFHWNEANFDFRATFIGKDLSHEKEHIISSGWTHSRNFFLSDLSDEPQWTAALVVFARSTRALSRFKIANVTPDTMEWAAAWRHDDWGNVQWIYEWERDSPEESYNALYGEMPLD
ncbi:hypothetical protein CSHISOI_10317, partial [Colletotrichum shisoi]